MRIAAPVSPTFRLQRKPNPRTLGDMIADFASGRGRVFAGGDGTDEPVVEVATPIDAELQAELDRVGELTAEELTDLDTRLRAAIEEAQGEPATEEGNATLEALVNGLTAVSTETTAREEAAAAVEARRQELLSAVPEPKAEDPEPEPEPEADPAKEEAPQAVAAAAEPEPTPAPARVPVRTAPRAAPRSPEPAPSPSASRLPVETILASGARAGQAITSRQELAEAFVETHRVFSGPSSVEMRQPISRSHWEYPEERSVRENVGAEANSALLAAAGVGDNPADIASLTAAGGLCAPLAPSYEMVRISDDRRPVRDALPQFGATRGGVNFVASPSLADFTDAVGVWTVENDEDAATDDSIVKDCVRVDCEGNTEVQIEAIYKCLTFGNLGARAFPEQVANAVDVTGDAHAQLAERQLLARIRTNSVGPVIAQTVLGTARDVLTHLNRWATNKRALHRMPRSAPLQVLFPEWLLSSMQDDLTRQMPGDNAMAKSDAEINGYFNSINVDVVWFATNDHDQAGQRRGVQGANALDQYPLTVEGYGFHPGAHVFMDGGELDFGLVRDSALNSQNDYQIFAETFEGLYTPGLFSDILRLDICASGATAAQDDVTPAVCLSGS